MFPHSWRKAGWIVAVPSLVACLLVLLDGNPRPLPIPSWLDEAGVVLASLSLLVVAFSRERVEDEFIERIRWRSLVWAVSVNYGLVVVATLVLYDFQYLSFLCVNLLSVLLLYIAKFSTAMYSLRKSVRDEE